MVLMGMISSGTPASASDDTRTGGNRCVRLTITIVKNSAMETTIPLFCSIDLIPDATPRSSGGTEFMIAAMFGAPNMPFPRPMIRSAMAKTGYSKLKGSIASIRNERAIRSMPDVANHRDPYLSESHPERGPMMMNPAVSGSMKMPAQNGVDS